MSGEYTGPLTFDLDTHGWVLDRPSREWRDKNGAVVPDAVITAALHLDCYPADSDYNKRPTEMWLAEQRRAA